MTSLGLHVTINSLQWGKNNQKVVCEFWEKFAFSQGKVHIQTFSQLFYIAHSLIWHTLNHIENVML